MFVWSVAPTLTEARKGAGMLQGLNLTAPTGSVSVERMPCPVHRSLQGIEALNPTLTETRKGAGMLSGLKTNFFD
jgi:hypothetical protein